MISNNQPFNAIHGFDLGKIEDILISGNKTLTDKLLIVKYDASKNKYYLMPQEIQTVHGSSSVKFVLGEDDYNYNENFIFSKTTNHENSTSTDITLSTIGIDITNKTQGIISLKGQIFAKHYDLKNTYEYYSFCTGRTSFYENKDFSEVRKRIVYDKFVYLFNNGKAVFVKDKQYERVNFQLPLNKQYFVPHFSTIGNSKEYFNLNNCPYIEFEETTNGFYLINIKCNPLVLNNTKDIKWFGNLELSIIAQ